MTDINKRREKIQRGVGDILLKRSIRQFSPYSPETIGEIFNYLHAQGVAIKVDSNNSNRFNDDEGNWHTLLEVEPLIKEDTNDQGTTVHTGKDDS